VPALIRRSSACRALHPADLVEITSLKAAFATGLVVLLLFGGLRSAALVSLDKTSNSDPIQLARATWIPAPLWKVAFVAVALYCVWKGILVLAR
jgi:hypothetical protein